MRAADYPAPYPTGWYRVAESRELKPGQLMTIDALGEHLVAFRGEDGVARVLDAHCPHQGASLAGGRVDGNHVVCPFHAWRFDAEGCLTAIPGLDRVPRVGVRSHPVVEQHGMIWMFHHVSGRATEPPYAPEPVEAITAKGMTYRGRHDAGVARMHLVEFIENSVDFQHFAHVHGGITVPWTTLTIPGLGLSNNPRWWADPDQDHLAYFAVDSVMTRRGRSIERTRSNVKVTMFGPAGMVWFHFDIPDVGEILLFETHLPLAPFELHTLFRWYAEPKVPSWLAWIVVGQWVANWKADLAIWENKIYRQRPVLVELDGPVRPMRQWYRQFLTDEQGQPEGAAQPSS